MRNTVKFAFVIICCFLCQLGGLFAQDKSNENINTVFDDAMMKSVGLTMNQYYNKLYAYYFEHNDYEGPKMGFNFTYFCPLVVINNRHINEISPRELYFAYSKIISWHFVAHNKKESLKWLRRASEAGGDADNGVIFFDAEYKMR